MPDRLALGHLSAPWGEMQGVSYHGDSVSACARRFSDAYAGKKAKLADAAVRNRAGRFIRYSKADWTFAGLDIPIPAPDADWSRFNLTDLEGDKAYPIVTTTIIVTDSDLTGRGSRRLKPCLSLAHA